MSYAIRYGPQGYGLNTNAFATTNVPTASHSFYNSPQGYGNAFEMLLQSFNPSLSQDRTLRQIYDSLVRRYQNDAMNNPLDTTMRWTNWLTRQDWNKELASLSPQMRNESGTNFFRPARWVAFT